MALFPPLAVQCMFPGEKQLPQLQRVYMAGMDFHDFLGEVSWGLDSNDLASTVCCCPGLMGLTLDQVVAEGVDVTPLLQLPQGCTALRVGGGAFGNDAAAVVRQLTQVQDLSWSMSDAFTDLGLQRLTVLTQLERLTVGNCGLTEGLTNLFDPPGKALRLRNTDSQVCSAAHFASLLSCLHV